MSDAGKKKVQVMVCVRLKLGGKDDLIASVPESLKKYVSAGYIPTTDLILEFEEMPNASELREIAEFFKKVVLEGKNIKGVEVSLALYEMKPLIEV